MPDYFYEDTITDGMKPTDYIIPWIEFENNIATKRYSKYGAINIEGFDSVSEYIRYQILSYRQDKGLISDLKRQVKYSFPYSKRIYIPDFTYRITEGDRFVAEDVKSPSLKYTKRFIEAEQLMKKYHGIIIKVVSPQYLSQW